MFIVLFLTFPRHFQILGLNLFYSKDYTWKEAVKCGITLLSWPLILWTVMSYV
jgi:hypothetical protein